MAKTIELTKTVLITDAGATAVDRQFTTTAEIEELAEGTLRVAVDGSKFICIAGQEGAEVSPQSLDLSEITGFSLHMDVQIELQLDGANPGVMVGPGQVDMDRCALESIKLVGNAGLVANVKYIIWGNR